MRHSIYKIFLALICAMFFWRCEEEKDLWKPAITNADEKCRMNSQCPGDTYCKDGFCVQDCSQDNDCRGRDLNKRQRGEYCVVTLGQCRSGCFADNECSAGQKCNDHGKCERACIEEKEKCDGKDNDCDGKVDEDFTDLNKSCSVGKGVCQRYGVFKCKTDGTAVKCDAQSGTPETEQCDGFDNDCDGEIDENLTSVCETDCGAGTATCQNSAWVNCTAPLPEAEVCDGKDNNCDGEIDEGIKNACDKCGPVPEETCNNIDDDCDGQVDENLIRACETVCNQGVETCVAGVWQGCSAILPTEEICDGLDNNCNGKIDEVCECKVGDKQECGLNEGICRKGIQTCTALGWGECVGMVKYQDEVCDGIDNDCDGKVDEGLLNACNKCGPLPEEECNNIDDDCDGKVDENLFKPCESICGLGADFCQEGKWTFCSAPLPKDETCNGKDDDCDGIWDNGCECLPGETMTCGTDLGECEKGEKECLANGKWGGCEGAIWPQREVCDNKDNNCDLAIDEGLRNSCGQCFSEPIEEICNGLDDDCDAKIDENLYRECQSACGKGYETCVAGQWQGCNAPLPQLESCATKGIDDDCDGVADEDCICLSTSQESCGRDEGECQKGLRTCQDDGQWGECVGEITPTDEICDEKDNDCDGAIDEGLTNACGRCGPVPDEVCDNRDNNCNDLIDERLIRQCLTECGPGVEMCFAGEWVGCTAPAPEAEICDGLDNNCDDTVDENCECFPHSTRTCGFNNLGECVKGDQKCGDEGKWEECIGAVLPVAESCDSKDNDCDGVIDNGVLNRCGQCGPEPKEICNEIDDDCDGKVDDGFDLMTDLQNCGQCNTICRLNYAIPQCVAGQCRIAICQEGFYDLNNVNDDGCEYPCFITKQGRETCDYIDNNCDGQADEEFNLASDVENCGACGKECILTHAISQCLNNSCEIAVCEQGWIDLNGLTFDGCEYFCTNSGPEVCDAAIEDEDCDGSANVGCACTTGETRLCDEGIGTCESAVQTCADGVWSQCQGGKGPVPEVCDSQDNDCDGIADEDFDFQNSIDTCGNCATYCQYFHGIAACVIGNCQLADCETNWHNLDGKPENGCEYGPCLAAGQEFCNGVDDDCNGKIDEIFDVTTDPLNCSACGRVCILAHATPICVNGSCEILGCEPGWFDSDANDLTGCENNCTPDTADEGPPLCDGIDNDCDYSVDENCKCAPNGIEIPCGKSTGECERGFQRCINGQWDTCQDSTGPVPEVCDYKDNDCDGDVDNGFDLTSDIQNCGSCGNTCMLNNATAICVNSICRIDRCDFAFYNYDTDEATGCEYGPCVITRSGVEYCDTIDNNCDGQIDESCAPVNISVLMLCPAAEPNCEVCAWWDDGQAICDRGSLLVAPDLTRCTWGLDVNGRPYPDQAPDVWYSDLDRLPEIPVAIESVTVNGIITTDNYGTNLWFSPFQLRCQ